MNYQQKDYVTFLLRNLACTSSTNKNGFFHVFYTAATTQQSLNPKILGSAIDPQKIS